jgi:hypothetical protein
MDKGLYSGSPGQPGLFPDVASFLPDSTPKKTAPTGGAVKEGVVQMRTSLGGVFK